MKKNETLDAILGFSTIVVLVWMFYNIMWIVMP